MRPGLHGEPLDGGISAAQAECSKRSCADPGKPEELFEVRRATLVGLEQDSRHARFGDAQDVVLCLVTE
jgi:hypothetical protein